MSESVLAIDLGTSSTKVLLVSRDGEILWRQRLPHATHRPAPDAAEQDPAEWWQNLCRGLKEMPGAHHVTAVGVTGQMHGLVVHADDGSLLRPAITWEDRRSVDTIAALRARLPEQVPLDPGYQAASWHWLMQAEPETAARAAFLLLPKDEVIHRLTGTRVTDPSDAIGTGWYRAEAGWDVDAIAAAGAHRDMLPSILPAGSIAGGLTSRAALALGLEVGTPIVIAGGDATVAAFGAGATEPGTPLLMLSTGCQALLPSASLPKHHAWPSANPPGLPPWLQSATTLNGGNVAAWGRETFGEPANTPDPDLTFLPYLAGERSPHLSTDAAGAFVGLRTRHDRTAMARSVIDGVSLGLADVFSRAGGRLGVGSPVLAGGGGTRDDTWLQSVADALGRPVAAVAEADLSAWGAARSAATSLGWIDPATTPTVWRPATRTVMPSTSRDVVAARLERFRRLAARLFGEGHP